MAEAASVLVYTSTIGIEAALKGKPVVVGARVYYAGKGFAQLVRSVEEYPGLLEASLSGRAAPDSVMLARRFAYLLLFRFLRHIPVVRQRPGSIPLLEPADVDGLLPGASPQIDELADAILRGHPLLSSS
jgi:hypothetical protein